MRLEESVNYANYIIKYLICTRGAGFNNFLEPILH